MNITQVAGQFDAIHDDVAPLVFLQAVDGADKGGLAASRWSADDDYLAYLDSHVHTLQHVEIAEPLVHVSTDDDIFYGFESFLHHFASKRVLSLIVLNLTLDLGLWTTD